MTSTERGDDSAPSIPEPAASGRRSRPRPIQTAFILWLVAALLQLLDVVLGLVAGSQTTGSAILLALLTALVIALVLKMRSGERWARTVLTVLAVLALLGAAAETVKVGVHAYWFTTSVPGGLGIGLLLMNILQLAVWVVAPIPMFTANGARYFAVVRRAR